jgi:hypothetical protein
MNGYFQGRDSMLQRIKDIKQSKIKVYFSYMFSGIFGLSMSKLLFNNIRPSEDIFTLSIIIFAVCFTFIRKRGEQ